jgi:GNAT superfamily N-acetyltransferase
MPGDDILYRQAQDTDISQMAEIRAGDWGTEAYWRERIRQYLAGDLHPREALPPRVSFVGVEGNRLIGLIAGHLTHRFGCDGELEWISVRPEYRKRGVAGELFGLLRTWFLEQDARYICVDVEPSNEVARRFYARLGAQDLKPHWMVWKDIGQIVESRLQAKIRE